jgi:hypothetical protein
LDVDFCLNKNQYDIQKLALPILRQHNIVTYTPTATQGLIKHSPTKQMGETIGCLLLGNG